MDFPLFLGTELAMGNSRMNKANVVPDMLELKVQQLL